MTFTYTPASPTDVTRVRFHIGDTDEMSAILTDETITFAIAEAGSWQAAVIWCLDYIIQQLSLESGTTLDWLELERGDAIDAYEKLKAAKRSQLGLTGGNAGGVSGGTVHTTRRDVPGGS